VPHGCRNGRQERGTEGIESRSVFFKLDVASALEDWRWSADEGRTRAGRPDSQFSDCEAGSVVEEDRIAAGVG